MEMLEFFRVLIEIGELIRNLMGFFGFFWDSFGISWKI